MTMTQTLAEELAEIAATVEPFHPDARSAARSLFEAQEQVYKRLPEIIAALRAKPAGEGVDLDHAIDALHDAWFSDHGNFNKVQLIIANMLRTRPAEGVRKAAELAAMYLATGFIECPRCGHEVPTEHTDAEYALREALADQPTSLQKTQTSADQPASDVAPERGR